MKKVLVVVGILVLALSLGAFAFQNEPEEFRGLLWGDPPTEEMKFLVDSDDMKAYTLPDDKMYLGDVTLYRIAYMFFEGRFTSVGLYYNGEDNYKLLETICKERYGVQEVDEVSFYQMRWDGQKSFVILAYDFVKEGGYLAIGSTPITMEKMAAQKKKEAEKAAGDW